MGKLGYSSMTLTDLTETIPMTLVLETNQKGNIQTKTGSLYVPNFEKEGEELIITPTLFLGKDDLKIEERPEYVKPEGRNSGFIYYILNYLNTEDKYYYGSSNNENIYVDEYGALHIKENLTANLTVEAQIEDFYNATHDYTIDLIQAANPVNFLFLEDNPNNYTVVVYSNDGRQHFEDENASMITLNAKLYKGIEIIFSTEEQSENTEYKCEWYQLSKGLTVQQENGSFEITRTKIYSEEKVLCKIINNNTALSYSGTIDLWDLKEDYDCVIIMDSKTFNEVTETITLSANVYNSQGELINSGSENDIQNLSYQWGRIYLENEQLINKPFDDGIKKDFILNVASFTKEDFLIYCKVFISGKLIANELETIQFVPQFFAKVIPENIFIRTSQDNKYLGNDTKEYTFKFQLIDKQGNILPYNNQTDTLESSTNSDETKINFNESEDWNFTGTIHLNTDGLWGSEDLSSKYYEFDYTYCGQVYSSGITIVKNVSGSSAYTMAILSSSGSSLSLGDTETTLTAEVYYGGNKIITDENSGYTFRWFIEGEKQDETANEIVVNTSDFTNKVICKCTAVYEEKEVGSAFFTLMDQTDSLPISLMLDSNLSQNIQIKKDSLYRPDFTSTSIEITPSLFIGNTLIPIPTKDGKPNIYYKINSNEYHPTDIISSIYVDLDGILHIQENLSSNITIYAYIADFKYVEHNIERDLIQATNPINILFLDETDNNIYALISSDREYFDDSNTTNITLTVSLYRKGELIEDTTNFSYEWSDSDSLLENEVSNTLSVSRDNVQGRNLYTCVVTDNTTGFEYVSSKIIQDFKDEYECRISYDKPLLLNSKNSLVTLSASLWNKNTNTEVSGQLKFNWYLISSDGNSISIGNEKNCEISINDQEIPRNSAFTVTCQILDSEELLAANLVTFQYVPNYSVKLSPQNFYISATQDGYAEVEKDYTFTFQLVDEDDNILPFTQEDEDPQFSKQNDEGITLTMSSAGENWSFTGIISITSAYCWGGENNSAAKTYEFSYVYAGQIFTEEINIIKNIKGQDGKDGNDGISPINVVMLSSSGSILTYGDTGTELSVHVYRGNQELSPSLLKYKWYKDGQSIDNPADTPEKLSVAVEHFGNKATYTCEVYDNTNNKLGEASYTLIDHTDDVPVTLTLDSNLDKNIQIKTGNKIEPNFRETSLIIEPLFYVNNTRRLPSGITYKINGNEYSYSEEINSSNATIYVEEDGILYIKENLFQNFTITASVDFNSRIIQSSNSINFLFLEEGMDSYHLVIASSGSRTFFDDSNMSDITLTPILYKGNSPTSESVSYAWDNLSEKPYGKNDNSITIPRASVAGRDLYTCTATIDDTGLSYTASVVIQDFTDQYECRLVYDKPLLLNSSNPEVTITASTWDKNKGANGKVTSIGTDNITYAWEILSEGNDEETPLTGGSNGTYKVSITDTNIPKNKNFTIICHSKIVYEDKTERLLATNTVTFQYVPEYSVKISPQNIFVLTDSSGNVLSTSKTHTFNFKLVDKDGNPLSYTNSSSEAMPNFTGSTNNEVDISFSQPAGEWNFTGTINLTSNFSWGNSGSKTYEFSYTYFGQQFSEEVNLIKNQKGADGAPGESVQGISAYSVDFTNEFHVFKGGESIATPGQTATCEIQGFYGDQPCTITKITANDTTKNLATNGSSVTIKNLNITSAVQGSKVVLTFTTGGNGNFVTSPDSIAFYITIENPDTEATKTFLKTFSYTINYLGESYYLELSNNTIKYSEAEGFEVNQIIVSALTRANNGAPNTYDGKIIYAYEYSDSSSTWKTCSGSIVLAGQKDLRNIQIRLYSSKASDGEINTDWLENNSQYLLDRETIPILHSLDGYEFGGENLLRWTKTLPLETNKWTRGSNATSVISTEQEGDFSVASFSTTSVSGKEYTYYSLNSPKIKLTKELIGKEFCLSCYFYCDDYSKLTSKDYSLFILAAGKEFSSDRNRFGTIGTVHATEASSMMKFLDTPQSGKWCRIYTSFKIDENVLSKGQTAATKDENGNYINGDYIDSDNDGQYDSGEEILTQIEDCNYFWIQFYSVNTCSFKIKQPMLVQGNTFSAWNASPYDVSYDEIVNANISIVPGLNQEISATTPYLHFADLSFNTTYTFSFQSSAWLGNPNITNFYCYLYKRDSEDIEESAASYTGISFKFSNDSETKKIKTFTTPSDNKIYSFRIYAIDNESSPESAAETDILILEKIKLEKGNQATSFFLTDEQLQEIIDNTKADTLKYTNELGDKINLSISDAQSAITDLQKTQLTIDEVKGVISTETSAFYIDDNNFIKKIRGKIEASLENASEPYIQIKTEDSANSFSIKITDKRLSFYEGQGNDLDEVAYISGKQLEINSARFNKNFYIGDLLVTVTDTGVGFTW